jgi:hypothetical protein
MPAENLKTSEKATAKVNAHLPRGTYRVLAEKISITDSNDESYVVEKGDEIQLEGSLIPTLLDQGEIEPV